MELMLFRRLERDILGDRGRLDAEDADVQRRIEAFSPDLGLPDAALLRVRGYVERYNQLMADAVSGWEPVRLRYYQVLALLFTEQVLAEQRDGRFAQRMLAYWMATGSGKTLVMHLNVLQYLAHLEALGGWNRLQVILTTPGVNLIEQHRRELVPFMASLNRRHADRIELRIDTTMAMLNEPDDYWEMSDDPRVRRLVLVDEGHLGLGSKDEGEFKRLRDRMNTRHAFLFEYSATYHNLHSKVQKEYERLIVFEYSYRKFYRDGYGKDYHFLRVDRDVVDDVDQNLAETFRLLDEKLADWHTLERLPSPERMRVLYGRLPVKPLLAFMGNTVNDPKDEGKDDEVSDVNKVIHFLAGLTPAQRRRYAHVFHGDMDGGLTVIRHRGVEDEILLAWGEGAPWGIVNVGGGDRFFTDLELPPEQKRVNELIREEWLFRNLDHDTSPIHVLIGSRKFAEGWNSYRLGVIGLVNLGKSKGNQIIQIFGRGVRLHGVGGDGKRRHREHLDEYSALGTSPRHRLRRLETLVVTSLNRTYLTQFLDQISREVQFRSTRTVRVSPALIQLGQGETVAWREYRDRLHIFRLAPVEIGWKRAVLTVRDQGGLRLCDGIRYTVHGREDERRLRRFAPRLDYRVDPEQQGRDIRAELQQQVPALGGWLDRAGLATRIRRAAEKVQLHLFAEQDGRFRTPELEDFLAVAGEVHDRTDAVLGIERIDGLARRIVEDVVPRIARRIEHQINASNYRFDGALEQSTPVERGDFIYDYTVTRAFDSREEQDAWERDHKRSRREMVSVLKALRIRAKGRHVFSPLFREPADTDTITITPDRLNPGERKFVEDLREHISDHFGRQQRWEFYLLRNVATLRRIGIYLEDEEQPFFPDFVLWALDREEERTVIVFADPKGQMGMEDRRTREDNSKVRLGDRTWPENPLLELERRLSAVHGRAFELHSFLLLRDSSDWGKDQPANWVREHMVTRNVLRLDWHGKKEDGSTSYSLDGTETYLEIMFKRAGIVGARPGPASR